jgi:Uma2 family endonuclease
MTIQVRERVTQPKGSNGKRHGAVAGEIIWRLPPLESGDRLTRTEFERRYTQHPEIKKAELIEGVVYVASPVRIRLHSQPHARIMAWITHYWAATPGVQVADNGTYRLDEDNEPQPDVSMWIDQPVSGGAWIDEDDYLAGAPELLVEVAASTASIDLGDKKRAYQRIGVQEYLVLQVYEQKASWFRLQDGEYQAIPADAQGVLRSVLFPGLWLDPAKFWAADLSGLIATVQQGLTSSEHGAFVEQLKR